MNELAGTPTAELRDVLSALERHVALNAMDRLIFDEEGEFEGWEKTPQLCALLDRAQDALK